MQGIQYTLHIGSFHSMMFKHITSAGASNIKKVGQIINWGKKLY